MKKLFIFLGLLVAIGVNAQRVYVDSVDFAEITGIDTVKYFDVPRSFAGELLSMEIDFTALNGDSAYIQVGGSNTGRTFNNALNIFSSEVDSIQLDTEAAFIVNGHASNAVAVATAQASKGIVGDRFYYKYLAARIIKGDVTTGKAYFYIIKL